MILELLLKANFSYFHIHTLVRLLLLLFTQQLEGEAFASSGSEKSAFRKIAVKPLRMGNPEVKVLSVHNAFLVVVVHTVGNVYT